MSSLCYLGVDGEMSAADLSQGGRLIQIGFAIHALNGHELSTPSIFSTLINPGDYYWDPRAAAVHGYSETEILNAPTAVDADKQCVTWLAENELTQARRGIAIGFNVGAFDLPHIQKVLPNTALLFSRRTIDLNALCFTLEGATFQGSTPNWSGWKRLATTYAERAIAEQSTHTQAAHDAGYDALLHLHAWRFLRSIAHGNPLTVSQTPVTSYGRQVQITLGNLLSQVGLDQTSRLTAYPPDLIKGWANGGRVTDPQALLIIEKALKTITDGETG